jgi:uncharacterized caspase-like protein
MIAVGTEERPLDAYARETLQRLPLADATLSLWAYVLQPRFLAQVFAEYRGRSFEETLTFAPAILGGGKTDEDEVENGQRQA